LLVWGIARIIENVAALIAAFVATPFIRSVHLRASHSMGFSVEGRPAGQGMLNVPSATIKQTIAMEVDRTERKVPPRVHRRLR